MTLRPILLVGETPSLADSVRELLIGEGYTVRSVSSASAAVEARTAMGQVDLIVVAAANVYVSATYEAWRRGAFGGAPLVLVGSREPSLPSAPGLHIIRLPLRSGELLGMIRGIALRPQPSRAGEAQVAPHARRSSRR